MENVQVQEYFILSTLWKGSVLFRECYPEQNIGFYNFSDLHSNYFIPSGSHRTYSVWVCTIYQNAKLIMAQHKIPELTNGETPIKTYKD